MVLVASCLADGRRTHSALQDLEKTYTVNSHLWTSPLSAWGAHSQQRYPRPTTLRHPSHPTRQLHHTSRTWQHSCRTLYSCSACRLSSKLLLGSQPSQPSSPSQFLPGACRSCSALQFP